MRFVIAVALLLTPSLVLADWPASTQVMDSGFRVSDGRLISDASNGGVISLVGWEQNAHHPYFMNRVTTSGARAAGWTPAGLALGEYQEPLLHFAPDGLGGLWSAWGWTQNPGEPLLFRDRADASFAGPYAVTASDMTASQSVVADAAGGAIVGWLPASDPRLRLKRMQSGGGAQPGWPAAGLQLPCMPLETPTLLADGAGGVLALGYRTSDYAGCIWRVNGSAAYPAGWTAAGVALTASTSFDPVALLPSGAAHVIAGWSDEVLTKVQRVSLGGMVDPAWPAGGLEVPNGARLLPDGSGGLFVLSQSGTSANLRHVLSDGTHDANFGAAGIDPLDAGAALSTWRLGVTCAAGSNGGSIIFWRDDRAGSPQVRARWLLSDGTNDPNEAAEGRVVVGSISGQVPLLLDACSDGAGGAFLLWSRDPAEDVPYGWTAYVARVEPGILLGVPPGTSPALSLSAGPNPARGSLTARFSLPDSRPARLELLDLAGRRVRTLEVSGAGENSARFDDLGALAPGMYVLRISQGSALRTVRVAVIR